MGALANVMEDFETFLVKILNEDNLTLLRDEQVRLKNLTESLEYRKTDVIFLTVNGFSYNKKKDIFTKEENISYGKYPGKYDISVSFPDDYPQTHPTIRFKPLFNRTKKSVSEHVLSKEVCISDETHGAQNAYWKPNMNVKGALRIAYSIVTGEIEKPKILKENRNALTTTGNIYHDLQKVVKKEVFIKEFVNEFFDEADNSYSWGELAYLTSKLNPEEKEELVDYYNDKEEELKLKEETKKLKEVIKKDKIHTKPKKKKEKEDESNKSNRRQRSKDRHYKKV